MATCPSCGTQSSEDPAAFTITGEPAALERDCKRLSCRCGWSVAGHIVDEQFYGYPKSQVWPAGGHGPAE